jgi:hypothetical protein
MLILVLVGIPMLPLLIAGDRGRWEAWAFVIVSVLAFVLSRWLAARHHPNLLAERARSMHHEDTKA